MIIKKTIGVWCTPFFLFFPTSVAAFLFHETSLVPGPSNGQSFFSILHLFVHPNTMYIYTLLGERCSTTFNTHIHLNISFLFKTLFRWRSYRWFGAAFFHCLCVSGRVGWRGHGSFSTFFFHQLFSHPKRRGLFFSFAENPAAYSISKETLFFSNFLFLKDGFLVTTI